MSSVAKFDKAPLSEVVCGVRFNAPDFSSIHFGLYWQAIRERFPVPPLDKPPIGAIELMASPPSLRRVWYESADRQQLVQLQADRFHYNWKRRSEQDAYPHFEVLYPRFEKEWGEFQQWWIELDKLPIQPTHYELTYLNQIDADFGWLSPKDTAEIFSFLDLSWSTALAESIRQDFNFVFALPDEKGSLTITFNQGKRVEDNASILLLELTARSSDVKINMQEWFDDAYQFIVGTFVELLNSKTKEAWGATWLQ